MSLRATADLQACRRRSGGNCSASRTALAAIRAGNSGTAAFEAVEPALRPGVQALVFQVCAAWAGPRRCAGSWPSARRRRRPMPCCAPRWPWPGTRSSALRALHAGRPGGRGGQAQARTRAQASFINACLRRFLRERDALVAATDREPVAPVEPSALVDRAAAPRPSAQWQRDPGRQQPAGADDAARQRAQHRRAPPDASLRCWPACRASPVGDCGMQLVRRPAGA